MYACFSKSDEVFELDYEIGIFFWNTFWIVFEKIFSSLISGPKQHYIIH